jgi:hypothetical protein
MKWNIYFTSLFIDLDVYEKQDLAKLHRKVLEDENLKGPELFFCGEVIKIYTDAELREAEWLNKHKDLYRKILKRTCKHSKSIKKENCYRLVLEPSFLGFIEKAELLHAEVSGLIA